MMRNGIFGGWTAGLLALAVACSNGGPAGPDPGPGPDPDDIVPGQVLVRLAPGGDVADVNARHGTRTISALESQRVYLLEVPDEADVDEILTSLRVDPALTSASVNGRVSAPEAQGRSTMAFADPSLEAVDREDQEAIARIRASEAWSRSRGAGIVVAILDTGVDVGHPQLAGRIAPGADLVDGDADPSDRPDGIDNDGDGLVDEAVGHGTFIAGLVAAVAPESRILPIRILDSDGVGTAVDIARGVELAIQRGARVINMSLGMEIESEVLEEVIDEHARERGVVFVASAGNAGVDRRQYPAGQGEVIGVAATTPADGKADFSNWGSWISVSAPGDGLVSLLPEAAMGRWSGTSFASALASAEAAILIAFAPFARSDEIRNAIEDSAVELADARLGDAGRIDVAAALDVLVDRLGGGGDEGGGEVDFDALVTSVDVTARVVRLAGGSVISVPHDGVIDDSGDYRTLAELAAALVLGRSVRAEGEAIAEGSGFRAVDVRFDDE
ncbi:MAG TPA: S8 family serine peptidase [Gemmatimonadota bacterium]|nr:S8 family serine peptidase [Gemmatimonadota bacterium]